MALTDASFGLNIAQVEAEIRSNPGLAARSWQTAALDREQHWIGLPPETLLTPYDELVSMLQQLAPKNGSTLVDLGAAYGRLGLVIGRCFPELSFVGYECVAERVNEANRCLSIQGFGARIRVERQDLSATDFSPIAADSYFLYDFGSREAIEKTLEDLRRIASSQPIAVVGRGRASRDAIERRHPWLSEVIPPWHAANYSIYRSGYR